MTDQEKREKETAEFKAWSKIRVAELEEHFKTNPPKDGKYWHLRMEYANLSQCAMDSGTMAEWNLDLMRLCIECLEHSKQTSSEILKKWCSYWSCFVMDTVGEAHCRVGTQYYPRYGALAFGEEKKQCEEIIELGHKFWDLYPKEEKV